MEKGGHHHFQTSLNGSPLSELHDQFLIIIKENYKSYIRKAYGYLKNSAHAEDAVQDGILNAYKNLHKIKNVDTLPAWINRIVINKAIDHYRKNKRSLQLDADFDEILSYSRHGLLQEPMWSEIPNPEQDILKKENLSLLRTEIENLEDTYRIPLLLKDYEDLSIKDIAQSLNISESNAKVRIHRARSKLKSNLEHYFFPHQHKTE